MQKFLRTLTLLACLALPWVAQAQNTLTVADGTTTNSNVPVYGLYVDDFVRSQTIYPASMIEDEAGAMGMNGGVISSMTFYLSSPAAAAWDPATFTVKLAEVSASTLSGWQDVSTATTVYEGTLDGTQSTMTVTFTTPFTYNGGNLLLEIASITTGTWKSASFYGVAATGASWQGNNSSSVANITGTTRAFIPKTTFTFTGGTPITCRTVSNLVVSDITSNSAVLTWEDNNNTNASYSIYNGDQLLGTVAAGTYTYTATGLSGNTEYTLAVAANCSETDASAAKGVTFRTECDIISSMPYEDSFEAIPSGSYPMPYCWNKYNGGIGNYPYVNNSSYYARTGSQSLYFYESTSTYSYPDAEYAILPQVDVTAYPMNQNMISFWLRTSNVSYTNIEVGTMSDPTDPTTYTTVQTLEAPATTNTYTYYLVKLTNAPATDPYVVIRVNRGAGYVSMYVDDVVLDQMPSCWPISNLAADPATTTSATLTWDGSEDNPATTTYSVYKDGELVSDEATSPFTVTGLVMEGDYEFAVVANCGAGDLSAAENLSYHHGYCAPNPTSVDNDGLINVTFGTFQTVNNNVHPTAAPFYGNYYDQVGAAILGSESFDMNITWSTGYTYKTIVWIDWNNDLHFADSEMVFFGESENVRPTTLTATIALPEGIAEGYYRVRVAGADMYFDGEENPNPCFTSTYAAAEDYTLYVGPSPVYNVNFNYLTLAEGVVAGTAAVTAGDRTWGDTVTMTSTPAQDMRTARWYAGSYTTIPEGVEPIAIDTDMVNVVIYTDTTFTVVYGYGQFEIKGIIANGNQARMGSVAGNSPDGNDKYNYGTEATLTATANRGFQFVEWRNEDGSFFSAENPLTLVATQAYTLVAHFDVATYAVSATGEHGTFTGTGTYNYGELASIKAVADEHYHFVKWSDDNLNNPRNYRVIGDTMFTAVFEPDIYTVAIDGSAVATYTIKDAEGNDTVLFAYNTNATVEAAQVDEHYTFVKWTAVIDGEDTDLSTANPYTFAVESNITLVPIYDAEDLTLTIATNDADMGTVSFVGDEYTGTSVTADYHTAVTVKAEKNNNYSQFVNWTANGRDLGNANPITVNIDSTFTLTANFSFVEYAVTTAVEPAEAGSISFLPQTPVFNDDVTFTATANEHWVLDHWVDTENNPDYSTQHVEIMFSDLNVTAYFVRDTHDVVATVADASYGTTKVTDLNGEVASRFIHDSTATFTFQAGYGYEFAGWKLGTDIVSTDNPYTITVEKDVELVATVNPLPYMVLVDIYNDGDNTYPRGGAYVNQAAGWEYDYLTEIKTQLTTDANYGYVFDHWTNEAGEVIELPFTLTQDTLLYAHFRKDVFSVQAKVPADYRMMGRATGSVNQSEYLDEVELTAVANNGYHFSQWVDAEGNAIVESEDTVALNGNVLTYTTVMDTIFYAQFDYDILSVEANTNDENMGTVAISGTAPYYYSQNVTLTPGAKEHYHFVQWQDGNTDNPRSFLLTQDTVFTATFAIDTHTVTLEYAENKVDTIFLTALTNEKYDTNRFIYGTEVAAELEAAYGYTFTGWNFRGVDAIIPDNPTNFVLTQDTILVANFSTNKYTVTVASNDDNKGTATVNGEADTTVDYLTEVALVATPEIGYDFVEWRDATEDTLISTSANYTYQVVNTIDIVANFKPHAYVVTIATANETMGDVAWAAPTHIETLPNQKDTVADGTIFNQYSPIYGLYMDTYGMKSQAVYSADLLADLPAGAQIKQLTFYVQTPAAAAWTGTVQVKLSEMDNDAMATYVSGTAMADVTSATLVYTGQLDATGTTMSIVFNQPYTYNGGNLLYDLTCTAKGNYKSAKFYGTSATSGTTRYRQDATGSTNKLTFLPKVTFLYDADVVVYDPIEGVTYDTIDPDHVAHVEYQKSVAMEATANYGYHFDNWSNSLDATTSTDNPMTVASIEADVTYTANFDKDDFTITVASADELQGTVSIEGADLDTVAKYLDTVTLVAAPVDENHRLLYWENQAGDKFPTTGVATSDTLQVVVEKNDTYTATFGYQEFVLTAVTENIEMGGVYVNDPNNLPEPITVGDGAATATKIPVYGTYADTKDTKSQSIYPAADLANLNGASITGLTYYLTSPASAAWTATFEVKLSEIEETSYADKVPYDVTSATTVYTGTLNATGSTMTVTFDQPYTYNGGNLLVDITVATAGNYKGATFAGAATTGNYVSYNEYGSASYQKERIAVLPKVTIDYSFAGNTPSLPTSNAVVDYGTDVEIAATPAEHYHFVGWKGANGDTVAALGINATPTITVAGDSTLTALFDGDQMPMTYQVNNAIRGAVDGPATGEFNTQVTFTATANHGYEFAMWEDGNENNPRTVTVAGTDAENTYKAIFDYTKYEVFVSAENATVSVTNEMGDVHDSIYTDVDTIKTQYFYGQTIELTFTAAEHYHFAENDQKTYVVNLSTLNQPEPLNIVAVIDEHEVVIASNDVTMGAVTVDNVEGNYKDTLAYGTELSLAVTAATHHHFVKWSDDVEDAERTITVGDADIDLTAIFAINEYEVVAEANAEEGTASVAAPGAVGVEVFSDDFESGEMGDWTRTGSYWTITSGPGYSGYSGSASGEYNAGCYIDSYSGSDMLISPVIDLSGYASPELSFNLLNTNFYGDINTLNVYYRTAETADWTLAYTTSSEVNPWTLVNVALAEPSATYQIAFECVSSWSYGIGIDDVTVTGVPSNNISVLPNTVATFTAEPNPGYEFAKWTKAGVDVSTDNPYSMAIVENTTLTANFTFVGFGIQVATNNEVMGKAYINDDENQVTYVAPYQEDVVLHAAPEYGYVFINWTNNRNDEVSTENPLTISATESITYTATFNFDNFDLVVTSADEERGTVTGAGNYPYGTQVEISAVANDGYLFTSWNDGVTTATRTVTVNGIDEYVASFRTDATYTVTVNAEHGTVAGAGSNFIENDQVILSASPANGYRFVNYTDAAGNVLSEEVIFSFNIVSDTVITANFSAEPYTLTLLANEAQGTVTGAGEYLFGTEVEISATANEGYVFDQWSDDVTTNPRTIVINGDITLTALFESIAPTQYYIGATAVNGTVSGTGMYNEGATVTLVATPDNCYQFVDWRSGNEVVSTSATYTFTATDNMTFMANFQAVTPSGNHEFDSVCYGGSVVWHNVERTVAQDYTYEYTGLDGCPAVDTLSLTIFDRTAGEHLNVTICEGSSYEWHGTPRTVAQDYYYDYNDVNGCPVQDTLSLAVNAVVPGVHENVAVCPGSSYTWHDVERTVAQDYYYDYTDANLCPVQDTLTLTNYTPIDSLETVVACDSYEWNGNVFDVTDIYYSTYTDANGCQADYVLDLTINYSVFGGDTTVASCENFEWNGVNYTTSGDYVITLPAFNGCDSTLSLHLTINHSVATTINVEACDSFTWATNGETYNASGNYIFDTVNALGCDSTVTLALTINHSSSYSFETVATGSYDWNGTILTESGIYVDTIENVAGCDSIMTLTLTVIPAEYTVNVSVNDASMGNVTPAGNITVTSGETISLTATANTGYHFVNWSNGLTDAAIVITVTSDTNLIANFAIDTYTIEAVASNPTMGYVTGAGEYTYGQTVVLEAHANEGYRFVRWSNGETNAHIEFPAMENVTLTAMFESVGIDDVENNDVEIYSAESKIFVKGCENMDVYVYDVNGRCVNKQTNAAETVVFTMNTTGVYLVKVGNAPAKRVVVVR